MFCTTSIFEKCLEFTKPTVPAVQTLFGYRSCAKYWFKNLTILVFLIKRSFLIKGYFCNASSLVCLLRHTEKNKNQLIISVYLGAPDNLLFGGKQEIHNTKFFTHLLFTVQKISSNSCELVRSCCFLTEKAKLKEEEEVFLWKKIVSEHLGSRL